MSKLSEMVDDLVSTKSKEGILNNIVNLLDVPAKPKDLKEVVNLPLSVFRDVTQEEYTLISGLLKVETIKDLANTSYKDIVNNLILLREGGLPKEKMELIITAAKYIVKAIDYKPVEGQKIVVVGLDNAGKTALLNAIKKEVGLANVSSLKPTQGVVRSTIYIKEQELYISELGGQERYRKLYLEAPEKYVMATDALVFMIDLQDDARYLEALGYLEKVLKVVKYLQESPEFIILLHKADPDLISNEIFQEKMGYLMQEVKNRFLPYIFQYEILTTSIYNIFGMGASFAGMLKGLFSGDLLEEKRKTEAMGKLLDTIVDLILKQEANFTQQMDVLRHNLFELNIEVRNLQEKLGGEGVVSQHEISATPKKGKVLEKAAPVLQELEGSVKSRSELLGELKRLFVQKAPD
ncbi:MAG: hypothetical protein EU536_01290 [Promethearchaeota archaeon]|nr:MAG: hypothetical protein EU536_01290 [Candidatus Lokiarchaeota archaeon]